MRPEVYNPDGSLLATTDEYWTVEPVLTDQEIAGGMTATVEVLNTYAHNIGTLDGIEALPDFVGDNATRGNRSGRLWRPKLPDQRTVTLAMWVRGSDPDGGIPADSRAQFQTNWHKLKGMFGRYDRPLKVTRRLVLVDQTLELTAEASLGGDMALAPQGDAAGAFTVDLLLHDPYWYGPLESTGPVSPLWASSGRLYPKVYPLDYGTTVGASGTQIIVNVGHVPVPPYVEITGKVFEPALINLTTGEALMIEPDVLLDSGDSLVIDFDERTVFYNGNDVYYWLRRDSRWWYLQPGSNDILLTDTSAEPTDGLMVLTWRPRYW